MLSIRDPDTGLVHHDPFEILGVWNNYYDHLFTAQECDRQAQDDMLAKLSRRLTSAERDACEGVLTEEKCFHALQGMPRGKTPGSDGFPMEFFLTFWQSLGADLVRVLNVAYETGQLSTSQRRGLNIVLYKKNDRLDTKNWRPISLLNVDYKIATRAISGHLLTVLSTIIGPDQTCGYVAALFHLTFFSSATSWGTSTAKKSLLPFSLSTKRRLLIALIGAFFGAPWRRSILVQHSCLGSCFFTLISSRLSSLTVGLLPFFNLRGVCAKVAHCPLCCTSLQSKCSPCRSACHLGSPACSFLTLLSKLSALGIPTTQLSRLPLTLP